LFLLFYPTRFFSKIFQKRDNYHRPSFFRPINPSHELIFFLECLFFNPPLLQVSVECKSKRFKKGGIMDKDRRKMIIGATMAGASAMLANSVFASNTKPSEKENTMKQLKFYLDTHDRQKETFPAKITPLEFEKFYVKYKAACYAEGVVPVRLHVGYEDGRAFCLTMAPDAESVKRAHDKLGLPFDSITEVAMATPGDTFFRQSA
jgi:hypothetical protein